MRVGEIVRYKLSAQDVDAIQQRRMETAQYSGNRPQAGDVCPLVIVREWDDPLQTYSVNGQVFLDGSDTFWVTSRKEGEADGEWRAVDG